MQSLKKSMFKSRHQGFRQETLTLDMQQSRSWHRLPTQMNARSSFMHPLNLPCINNASRLRFLGNAHSEAEGEQTKVCESEAHYLCKHKHPSRVL